ncbi:MAG TPA: glycosyltransferase, partial [Candidatus Binataceae bacterium]|nr:glycosyltransferase [Candidatus Binataceae bacterium]
MKILLVATKPPWPLIDGGRVLLWHTMAGLVRHGAEITLVAPLDAASDGDAVSRELRTLCRLELVRYPQPTRVKAFAHAFWGGAPMSIVLHRFAAMRERVAALLAAEAFDLVHAEQLQAAANCEAADLLPRSATPLVLRSQNVESNLWHGLAAGRPALRPLLLHEARRLRAWEAQTVRRSSVTIALTRRDAAQLAALADQADKVHHVPAPFPAGLAPERAPRALSGAPPVVLFGAAGWLPNREGERWFIREVWPAVRARVPGAVLHTFGSAGGMHGQRDAIADAMVGHAPPADSSAVFAAGAVLVVPLRVASGVRVKILEAWARGVPVVATPQAAEGLEATDGAQLMLARDAAGFALAIGSI